MRPVLIIYPGGPKWYVYENIKRAERKSSYSPSAYSNYIFILDLTVNALSVTVLSDFNCMCPIFKRAEEHDYMTG